MCSEWNRWNTWLASTWYTWFTGIMEHLIEFMNNGMIDKQVIEINMFQDGYLLELRQMLMTDDVM